MSDSGALQFEQAEFVEAEGRSCAVCNATITDQYFAVNGKTLCTRCRHAVLAAYEQGTPGSRFLAALGRGGLAALIGPLISYGTLKLIDYPLSGLAAVFAGLLVGKSVARGARGRGGAGYQILAIALTYLSIVLIHLPQIVSAWNHHQSSDAGPLGQVIMVVLMGLFSLVAPIYICFKAPVWLFITGIALYEAWKFNKRAPLAVTGPHALAPQAALASPPPPQAPPSDAGPSDGG